MAKNLGTGQTALPNPFQTAIVTAPILTPSIVKTVQTDTSFFHGYRSTFSIDQQKEQYQQQKNEQQQQQQQEEMEQQQQQQQQHYRNQRPQMNSQKRGQFSRNDQYHRNQPQNRNANRESNHTNAAFSSNWCELCERGFKFPHQLEKHRSEHEKCWFDDCTFEGHSQLLRKHIEVQHQSGLFQRIVKIETDEDIEKWREERRKRYPTAANIETRRQAQEQRLKRGERIEEPTHRFGNMNNRKRAQHHTLPTEPKAPAPNVAKKKNDKKRRRTRQKHKNRLGKQEHVAECGKNEIETTKNETVNAMVSTEITSCVATVTTTEKMAQNSSALAAIMGMYGSDSDSDDGEESTAAAMATMTMTEATATSATIEDKIDENVCPDINPLESNENLVNVPETPSELEVPAENVVANLKRSAEFQDELPNKQMKIDSDMIENIEQNVTIESDDDAPDEQPIQRQSENTEAIADLESGPTETKPITAVTATLSQNLTNERIPKRKTVLDMTRKIRNQNTLLEKLLQKDIRHERNILLQCVRYVVEQKFFGIEKTIDEENNKV